MRDRPQYQTKPEDSGFKLSVSQEQIALLLHQRLGAYYKDVFVDICRMMSKGDVYNSQRYLAGHLISELESGIRRILMPITGSVNATETKEDLGFEEKKEKILSALEEAGYPNPRGCGNVSNLLKNLKQPDAHGDQIKRIISDLGFEENQSIAFWLEVYKKFHGLRHLPRSGSPAKVDEDFNATWEDFQKLLRFILLSVDKRYTAFLKIVSDIKNVPSTHNLKRLEALPPNVLTQKSFFKGNSNPEWLPLLDRAGYFKSPPPLEERLDDEKAVNAFHWPAAEYLTKMADSKDVQVQKKVLEIVQRIPKTGNIWVNRELINIAKALPFESSIQLYSKIEESTSALKGSIFLRDIADVIKYWAQNEKGDEALNLTKVLFSVEGTEDDAEDRSNFRDNYEFQYTLEIIRAPLVKFNPIKAMGCFCSLLDKALINQYKDRKDDYQCISLPDIGRDSETSRGVANYLVMTIRDAAVVAISEGLLSFEQVEELLGQYNWDVFQRLIIFIASEFPEKAPKAVSRMLLDKQNQDKHSRKKEYKRLALKGYAYLSDDAKAAMTKRLEDGPLDVEKRLKDYSERTGKQTTEKDIERNKEIWLRDELKGWVEVLPEKWQKCYTALVSKLGEGFDNSIRITRGPESPKSAQELKELEPSSLAEYLRNWKPPEENFIGPSIEGLRQELKKLVKENSAHFLANIERFFILQPSYIQGILSAFKEIVLNKVKINWDKAFALCEWVISQKDSDTKKTPGEWDTDNSWKWTYLEIGNLIEAGFQSHEKIPIQFRERIWSLLDFLRHYKESDNQKEGAEENDLYQRAIATVPGQALECVIKYGLWIRRHEEKRGAKITGFADGLSETQAALDEHLNAGEGPVLKSIYGRYFPWLQLMDKNWTEKNIHNIFSEPLALNGAWKAFIIYSGGPYKDGFQVIKPFYEKAIAELNIIPHIEDRHYYQLLGERIMVFIIWGEEKVDGDFVSSYFKSASDEDRAHCVRFASRSLSQVEVEKEVIDDIKRLADVRLEFISKQDNSENYQKELKRYGVWFGSEHINLEWKMNFFEKLISKASRIDGDTEIFKFLELAFPHYSKRVMICLENVLFNLEMDYWEIQHNKEHISAILLAASNHSDSKIREKAEDIRNQLVANNH